MPNRVRLSHASRLVFLVAALLAAMVVFSSAALARPPVDEDIVGGQEADPGEWPHQVALVGKGPDLYQGQFCGGTIIDSDWVLTAAHCVFESTINDLDVVAGIHDLDDPDPNFVRRTITQIVVHPDWDEDTFDNDMALLKLSSPVPERAGGGGTLPIVHAPLVAENIGPLTGVNATVTGWGNTLGQPNPGGQNFPDRLQEVVVPIIANSTCNAPASYGGSITDNMLCAGFAAGGKDSCQGDSGGPLVVFTGGQWKLAGVVSFGQGCAAPNFYGVYARVSRYTDWVNSIVNPIDADNFAYVPIVIGKPAPPQPPPSPLVNGNFEQGPNVGWVESSNYTGFTLVTNDFDDNQLTPHSGAFAAWLGGVNDEEAIITQQVTVPTGQPFLRYYYIIGSQETLCGFDEGGVAVNGNPLQLYGLCDANESADWVLDSIDLSAFKGQSVTLQFFTFTDGSFNSNLFIDDVSFAASAAAEDASSPGAGAIDASAPRN